MAEERKPGAGLGQYLPQEPDPIEDRPTAPREAPFVEEPPTNKLPTVPDAPPEGERLCPVCGGGGELHTTPYAKTRCPNCNGDGTVTREEFERFIAEHPKSVAARQLARRKGKI